MTNYLKDIEDKMGAELQISQNAFQKQMLAHYQGLLRDPLSRFREKAWDHFEEIGLPLGKTEAFQYVKLKRLFEKNFQMGQEPALTKEEINPFILPPCKDSCIVFVNGHLNLPLSSLKALPKKVLAICLKEALKSFGPFINNQVAKLLQEEVDPFAALNGALFQKALFFYVPPNTLFETPLQILQVVKGKAEIASPRIEMFVGALSEMECVSTSVYLDAEDPFFNGTTHFVLEEGAKLQYLKIHKNTPATAWHLESTRASLSKDASFHAVALLDGAESLRDDWKIALLGSNAEAHLAGLATLTGKKEAHTHVLMDHQAPACRSMQLFKSVLNERGLASFEGKIYVHKEAQKTEAFQLNNTLTLSDLAHAYCKPNLEIFADDVKASHGATVGQLEEEQLAYLRIHGLNESQAKRLLIDGFCKEILDKIPLKHGLLL